MASLPVDFHIDQLAARPELIEQVGTLRWIEWAYGDSDPARFIDVTRAESGDGVSLPMTFVAIDASKRAVGVVGLGEIDDELSADERSGRTPWILGMVVAQDVRGRGVGRLLLTGLQATALDLGHAHTWVATGNQAVGFYRRCGWQPVERLRLQSTGIMTTILSNPTAIQGVDEDASTSIRLELDRPVAAAGEDVEHVVVNDTDDELVFGLEYGLEQFTGEGWQPITITDVFSAAALGVGPHRRSHPMTATIPSGAAPGRYRILKTVQPPGPDDSPVGGIRMRIQAELAVRG
ncbi:GNAT family N-acetyltransferase [Microlunatus elymi]|uniref:GNAT family N-acetyltransferase n=1 Tax=Microlunatus elymi TaxID=2596828 RepID=A0A516PXQ9_9ACTN|nr:GNAT family N-acetyltransferase [Microlunatus elymi]QDP95964.1 GNAT family N-acetyltransferase [Microlunatus elymi]